MAGSAPTAAPPARTAVSRAIGAVSTVCGWASAAMIAAAVVITCQMIWVRSILNESTIWQTEAVTYLMIGATLIGLPYVQKLRGHVSVDLLSQALPPGPRRALAILVALSGLVIVAVMTWYGFDYWHVAFQRGWRSDTVWGPPLWIPYLVMPLGFALYFLQLLADLIDAAVADAAAADGDTALEESR